MKLEQVPPCISDSSSNRNAKRSCVIGRISTRPRRALGRISTCSIFTLLIPSMFIANRKS